MASPTGLERAVAVWHELARGNERFRTGDSTLADHSVPSDQRQHPVAAILSCSDARVPPQLVFDRGLGDLFTVRLAGAVAAPGAEASLRYAVDHLEVPLVVVLGHQGCGAVTAAVELVDSDVDPGSGLEAVVQPLLPACLATRGADDHVAAAVAESVRRTAIGLAGRLSVPVVPALYDLSSGVVTAVPSGVYCTDKGNPGGTVQLVPLS